MTREWGPRNAGCAIPPFLPFLHSSIPPLLHSSTPPFFFLCLFSLLAIVWTWPLAVHLGSRIPHDPGDPILTTWILWWDAQKLPFTSGWWDPPFLYPLRGGLALSEHLAGISVIATPLQRAGASPLFAYNVCLLLSYSLSGFFAFLLTRRLTGSSFAGICGGVAYGFAPYRAGQLAHLQVLTSQWLPLMLLTLHDFVAAPGRRALALFGLAWLLQALSNGYYLLFFPVVIALWLTWFVDWRKNARHGLAIVLVWIASSLPLLPVLWKYHVVQTALDLSRPLSDMQQFSAAPVSLLNPPPLLAFWRSVPVRTDEDFLFPGVTAVTLVAIALIAVARRPGVRAAFRERAPLIFYAVAAVLMYALSFGPAVPRTGAAALTHPYTLLTFLPGYGGLRAPARFAMAGTLCLSVALALAVRVLRPSAKQARVAFGAIVIAGLFIDGWTGPMPLALPPGRVLLPEVSHAVVMELPVDDGVVNTAAMYRQMFHRRPLINGYTGYTPPHYAILSIALRREDPSAIDELARGRPLVIVVSDQRDPNHEWRRFVERLPGIERHSTGSGGQIYVYPAQPVAPAPPAGTPIASATTRLAGEQVEMDLGATHTLRTIEFPVRWHFGELAPRVAVEVSADGRGWSTAWENWTGGVALAAALEDPRLVPVRLMLADVSARYVRVHPAPRWLAQEVKVAGP
jgi:hypothetical protein